MAIGVYAKNDVNKAAEKANATTEKPKPPPSKLVNRGRGALRPSRK